MRKLKKSFLAVLLLGTATVAMAMVLKYNAYLVNETGLTYSKTYALPVNSYGIDYLSFTSIASSATIAAVTVDMPAFTLRGTGIAGNNGFVLALPVLYTSTVAVGGLTTTTTYYATPNGSSAFYVSRTSTDAVAGNYITFTSTTAGAGFTIRFSPLGITGTPAYKWQISNDGVTWYDAAQSSVTLSSFISTGTLTYWDFNNYDYAWLRLNVTGPTTGAINLKVAGNGKNTSN